MTDAIAAIPTVRLHLPRAVGEATNKHRQITNGPTRNAIAREATPDSSIRIKSTAPAYCAIFNPALVSFVGFIVLTQAHRNRSIFTACQAITYKAK